MVKDLSYSERGNPPPPLHPISSKGSSICTTPTDRIAYTTIFVTPVEEHCLEREIAQWINHEGSMQRPIDPSPNALTTKLHIASDLNNGNQTEFHDWCNKGHGMCYPVCGIMHIKEPLLLIGKSSPYGGSGFPLSLFEWSFIICLTPYNRKGNVLSASLIKHFLPSYKYLCMTQ